MKINKTQKTTKAVTYQIGEMKLNLNYDINNQVEIKDLLAILDEAKTDISLDLEIVV